MDTLQTQDSASCPPHHWQIGNEVTAEGTVERWTCQHCDATRERLISRRRPTTEQLRRVIGEGEHSLGDLLGYGGERVA